MRVLCVGRHAYLSEHLCRVFRELGAECEPVVGAGDVSAAAARFEPHAVVSDCDLLTPALLDAWATDPLLAETPVLAVSLTRRPEEAGSPPHGATGVIYLPTMDRKRALSLLAGAFRPRGVQSPADWRLPLPACPPATLR